MSSIKYEPLDDVLAQYDIKVISTKNESYKDKKGVWWIETPDGYRILKKISNSEDTFKYILSAAEHLRKNGMNIPAVYKTRDGKDYVNINGTCYVLYEAIEGKSPSYNSPEEFKAIVKELARFHAASVGFSPLEDTKPKIHLGKWIEQYTNQLEDMNKFYQAELDKTENDKIGKIIIEEFPAFYERAKQAIEGLKGKEYQEWVKKVETSGGLCHQDFAAGNLLKNPSGKIFVLDTDSLTIDIPARDIRKLLNKIMKKNGSWDLETFKKLIRFYQSENPLTYSEWVVVKLDIMFPHLFLGAMNKFYYKRDKEWSFEKYQKRITEMATFEKTITPILENFESIVNEEIYQRKD
ncbi:CotS family spore coat protein [Acetivibrio mesophilus]|uniref:CotS family spore coat protein n=1 Tax=Acetivibrio mesophilus TaxID=2487273 RepID=A0A4V1K2D6_9FIRM|nr:CotS family spore coat protein [Acetivibrio mesophilus]ODM25079.1 serine kinase [Clostridium sp. Bc-iso-3]RXE59919.1 CotS family spore coat protein [Acetivibrio mesophilus]HHV29694.1 CotS family spore coat protein [Clostridium sp.]